MLGSRLFRLYAIYLKGGEAGGVMNLRTAQDLILQCRLPVCSKRKMEERPVEAGVPGGTQRPGVGLNSNCFRAAPATGGSEVETHF